jgi:SAM-dependent methyltransferase
MDVIGHETLRLLEKANQYLELSARDIGRWLKGKTLELGAGTGNLTRRLAFQNEITALDRSAEYLNQLKSAIASEEEASKQKAKSFQVMQLDLNERAPSSLHGAFDTLLSCQVLEHLPDAASVIRNYRQCLKPGGRIVLQLPAHGFAFSQLDKNLGHFRRYDRASVEALLRETGFKNIRSYYYNAVGLFGWLWFGKVLRRQVLLEKELSLFNRLAPLLLKLDLLFSPFFGLNVVAIGEM